MSSRHCLKQRREKRFSQALPTAPFAPFAFGAFWDIAKERQQQSFDMFKRLRHDNEYRGTGMDLAIVRTAVQRIGGAVCVDSEPGQGSQLCVELPAASQP